MSEDTSLDFPRALADTAIQGVIKSRVEDFYVEELMPYEPEGEGEHVWLWLEKQGQNTEFVAKQLARFTGLRTMDIGVSGLKDRWAITRQWFSLYLGNRPEPDWADFKLAGVTLLQRSRHLKKLRRGEHHGNLFRIRVSQLAGAEEIALVLEDRLQHISLQGFPNYFGEQRFGRDGANLERAGRYFKGVIKANRSQRGYYLSAVRAYLFNLNLAAAVKDGSWLQDDATGPLYGDETDSAHFESDLERQILQDHPAYAEGLYRNRLKMDRRAFCCHPRELSWKLERDCLEMQFVLPSGSFATSLLAELLNVETADTKVDFSALESAGK